MKNIPPFVANTADGMHCVPAVFRMLHQYYFKKDMKWNEVNAMMKVIDGKGAWTFPALTYFAKKGVELKNFEPVDYQKIFDNAKDYFPTIVGAQTAEYYLKKSNILSLLPDIPEFLETVDSQMRTSDTKEVLSWLKKDYFVLVELNSRILNKKQGFALHLVLIYDCDDKFIYLHDPGLPPIEARKVTIPDFKKAYEYAGANTAITVFKKI
jgi:hypothetical protein